MQLELDPDPLNRVILGSIRHIKDDVDAVLLDELLSLNAVMDSTVVHEDSEGRGVVLGQQLKQKLDEGISVYRPWLYVEGLQAADIGNASHYRQGGGGGKLLLNRNIFSFVGVALARESCSGKDSLIREYQPTTRLSRKADSSFEIMHSLGPPSRVLDLERLHESEAFPRDAVALVYSEQGEGRYHSLRELSME